MRMIASGKGWSFSEHVCTCGPQDRAFEEAHERFTIAAVIEGSFTYKSDGGKKLMHPGAFMLGNARACFECGHEHSTGDRCLAFSFEQQMFEEIAASVTGTARYQFAAATLPISARSMPVAARMEWLAAAQDSAAMEEAALFLCERMITAVSGHHAACTHAGGRDERRIDDVLRYIEAHASEPIDLDALAGLAGMSKFHFLHIFRAMVSVSPYQYVLNMRMRRAAIRIASTREPVSAIAFEAGFGDLSTFNNRFRRQFGTNPLRYRHQTNGG